LLDRVRAAAAFMRQHRPIAALAGLLLVGLAGAGALWFAPGDGSSVRSAAEPRESGGTASAPVRPTESTSDRASSALDVADSASGSGETMSSDGAARSAVHPPPPGPGTVVGRLIDAVSGLPVPEAGITLHDRGRRAISGPQGGFRFDGVPAGEVVLDVGPADGYLTRSVSGRMKADGLDIGLVPLVPLDAPTLVEPSIGGSVSGCGRTELSLPAGALVQESLPAEPSTVGSPGPSVGGTDAGNVDQLLGAAAARGSVPVRVTCIPRAEAFPAPPPAGRLPLAAIDLAPADATLLESAWLRAGLPSQPVYGPGVELDLFRLDAGRMTWELAGSLEVDAGGTTATGSIDSLGAFLAVAPPYGALAGGEKAGPEVSGMRVTQKPGGDPAAELPPGTLLVYGAFEYAGMENTPITVRTTDPRGRVIFESRRPYLGSGTDDVPMVAEENGWAVGGYDTTWYVGDPPRAVGRSVTWRIKLPTIQPDVRASAVGGTGSESSFELPWAESFGAFARDPVLDVRMPPPSACAPSGWYAYVVRPGDTLGLLATWTGTSASRLAKANCLASADVIDAGNVVYLPVPPRKPPVAGSVPGAIHTPAPAWTPGGTRAKVTPGWPDHGGEPWPGSGLPTSAVVYPTKPPYGPEPTLAPGPWPTPETSRGSGPGVPGTSGGASAPPVAPPPAAAASPIPTKPVAGGEPTLAPRPTGAPPAP